MLFTEFISTYGTQILWGLLTTAASIVGAWIGRVYKAKVDDDTKRKVVKSCCKAVRQIYKDLNGEEKYNKAVEAISEMLAAKSITITPLEIKILIEEVCDDFTNAVKAEVAEGVVIENDNGE